MELEDDGKHRGRLCLSLGGVERTTHAAPRVLVGNGRLKYVTDDFEDRTHVKSARGRACRIPLESRSCLGRPIETRCHTTQPRR